MKEDTTYPYKFSVIIPAYNNAQYLSRCLESLSKSNYPAHEIIVVDDNSSDNTSEVAESFGVKTIRLSENRNANYCRNKGAKIASGDIFLFVDSDVLLHEDTIFNIAESFKSKNLVAVVGLYSIPGKDSNLVSKYKNIWIRYSYMKSKPYVDWIFGAVSAISRDEFIKLEGFKDDLHSRNGIDDLELGKRMSKLNYSIELNPKVEGKHLKEFKYSDFLKNDFIRSQYFVLLAAKMDQLTESTNKGFVNIYPSFIYSTVLSLPILFTFLAGFISKFFFLPFVVFLGIYVGLNFSFLKYFSKYYGIFRTLGVFLVIISDHLVCSLGVLTGLAKWIFGK